MADDKLFKLGKPSFYIVDMEQASFAELYQQLSTRYKGAVIRMIRGKKSQTVSDFFDEVAAAMQFPYYFGENSQAFKDCITDLDWLEGDAYLLMIDDAHLFLRDAYSRHLRGLMTIFSNANSEWLTPNKYIPRNRPPTPFHILFRCSELDVFLQRLGHLAAEVEVL